MLTILVWLLMVSSVDMSKTITVIGDCKCQNRRYSAVWAHIRRHPASQGSAGRPISCVTKSDDNNMAVVSRIEEQFLILSYLNEFKLDQRINGKGCFMAYSWDSAHWTRCSSASEQCVLELATVPTATLMVKLVCPSKGQLRRMQVCPILIGHSVQDTRSNQDRVILMTIPDVLEEASHLEDMTSIEGDTVCDLRSMTIPEDARSFIASEVIAGKSIPYSVMRCSGGETEECDCVHQDAKSLPLPRGVSRPEDRMPFDFDFIEHISCKLVCINDFPVSIGDTENVDRKNQKRKQKKKYGH